MVMVVLFDIRLVFIDIGNGVGVCMYVCVYVCMYV